MTPDKIGKYQIVGEEIRPFDDRVAAVEVLKELGSARVRD